MVCQQTLQIITRDPNDTDKLSIILKALAIKKC